MVVLLLGFFGQMTAAPVLAVESTELALDREVPLLLAMLAARPRIRLGARFLRAALAEGSFVVSGWAGLDLVAASSEAMVVDITSSGITGGFSATLDGEGGLRGEFGDMAVRGSVVAVETVALEKELVFVGRGSDWSSWKAVLSSFERMGAL